LKIFSFLNLLDLCNLCPLSRLWNAFFHRYESTIYKQAVHLHGFINDQGACTDLTNSQTHYVILGYNLPHFTFLNLYPYTSLGIYSPTYNGMPHTHRPRYMHPLDAERAILALSAHWVYLRLVERDCAFYSSTSKRLPNKKNLA